MNLQDRGVPGGSPFRWSWAFRRRPAKGIPPALWRSGRTVRRTFAVLFVATLTGLLVLLTLPFWSPATADAFDQRGGYLVVSHWVVFLILGSYVIPALADKRLKRSVLRNDYRVCTTCAYVLRGLPAEDTCPECGMGYSYSGLRATWEPWVGAKARGQELSG